MLVIFCTLLAVGAIGFTLVVREQDVPPAPVENAELRHRETQRQVLYDNLKDLQFEYHQGKLSDEDYQSLKSGFLYDLAGVMDSIERLRAAEPKPAPQTGTRTAARKKAAKSAAAAPAGSKCPSCSGLNPPSNRFCGHCGAALH